MVINVTSQRPDRQGWVVFDMDPNEREKREQMGVLLLSLLKAQTRDVAEEAASDCLDLLHSVELGCGYTGRITVQQVPDRQVLTARAQAAISKAMGFANSTLLKVDSAAFAAVPGGVQFIFVQQQQGELFAATTCPLVLMLARVCRQYVYEEVRDFIMVDMVGEVCTQLLEIAQQDSESRFVAGRQIMQQWEAALAAGHQQKAEQCASHARTWQQVVAAECKKHQDFGLALIRRLFSLPRTLLIDIPAKHAKALAAADQQLLLRQECADAHASAWAAASKAAEGEMCGRFSWDHYMAFNAGAPVTLMLNRSNRWTVTQTLQWSLSNLLGAFLPLHDSEWAECNSLAPYTAQPCAVDAQCATDTH